MIEVNLWRIDIKRKGVQEFTDKVVEETPLHLFVNDKHLYTILCYPTHLEELAIGHLLSEGIVDSAREIQNVKMLADGICHVKLASGVEVSASKSFARVITSSCGSSTNETFTKLIDKIKLKKVHSKLTLGASTVIEAVRYLNKISETYRKTGGVHIAALHGKNGELIAYGEDIGRHNAVDKVIGLSVAGNVKFNSCFLVSSGRLTGDIVLKAARVGIPILASVSAPVSSGIEVAEKTGLTLIGFVRGSRMNIYTHPERIKELGKKR